MDLHRVAQIVKGSSPAGQAARLRLRQTIVVAVGAGTADVEFADGTLVEGVVHFSDVTPAEGDSLWVLTDGVDIIGIGVT